MITIYEYEQLDLYIGQGQPKLIKSWMLKTFGGKGLWGDIFQGAHRTQRAPWFFIS